MTELAALLLAAGEGTRLRPLTLLRPKPLCPVGNVPLLDLALERVAAVVPVAPSTVAVNAHHLGEQIVEWAGLRTHVSVEQPAGQRPSLAVPLIDEHDLTVRTPENENRPDGERRRGGVHHRPAHRRRHSPKRLERRFLHRASLGGRTDTFRPWLGPSGSATARGSTATASPRCGRCSRAATSTS